MGDSPCTRCPGFCRPAAPLRPLKLGPAPYSLPDSEPGRWLPLRPADGPLAASAGPGSVSEPQSQARLCLYCDSGSFLLEGVLGKLTPRLRGAPSGQFHREAPSAPPLAGGPPPPEAQTATKADGQRGRPSLTPASRCSLCIFCGERSAAFTEEGLDLHYWKHCLMLTRCGYCRQVRPAATWGPRRVAVPLRLGLSRTWVFSRGTK